MRRLGVSVYPDYLSMEDIRDYLARAAPMGYSRVFVSLLLGSMGFSGRTGDPLSELRGLTAFCAGQGLTVCADADETTLAAVGASPDNLDPFRALGIGVLRIDGGFAAAELAVMSRNPYGVGLEINASLSFFEEPGAAIPRLKDLMEELCTRGDPQKISACHNFFPLDGTGLRLDYASDINTVFRSYGIRVGGFVASQAAKPLLHPTGHGLPTLEAHRFLPPELAAAELFAAGFDDVTIGDCPASQEELRCTARAVDAVISIPVVFDRYADRMVIGSLLKTCFTARADQPDGLIRATQSRSLTVRPGRTAPREAFSVTVNNERSGRYTGELQITLRGMEASHERNVIGFVHPEGRRLLDYLTGGGRAFRLSEYTGQNICEEECL